MTRMLIVVGALLVQVIWIALLAKDLKREHRSTGLRVARIGLDLAMNLVCGAILVMLVLGAVNGVTANGAMRFELICGGIGAWLLYALRRGEQRAQASAGSRLPL